MKTAVMSWRISACASAALLAFGVANLSMAANEYPDVTYERLASAQDDLGWLTYYIHIMATRIRRSSRSISRT